MTPSDAISVLKRAGLTEQVIGAAVGARQSTINRIYNGQMQPNYELGKRLVDMGTAQVLFSANAQQAKAHAA